jgi:glycosyltransferase involved in cell wall biosynthesis
MTKIAILIPVWGRAKVLEKCLKQLNIFIELCTNYKFIVIFVLSDEDNENVKIRKMISSVDFYYEICTETNDFLGLKMNKGIETALKNEFDYLMNLGSDNLLHPYLMDLYAPYIELGYFVFGINSYLMYDILKEESYHYEPDMKSRIKDEIYTHPIGAGRMIHRSAIEEIIEKDGFFYDNDRMRGMDMNSGNKLIRHGYTQKIINAGEFPYIVDIKTGLNINTVDDILRMKPERLKLIDNEILNMAYNGLTL